MDIQKNFHPHKFRNRFLQYTGGKGGGAAASNSEFQLPDWFYWNDEEDSVHCKYPLVGDYEVSAYGIGEGGSGSGGTITIDGHAINEIAAGTNITIDIDGKKATINSLGGGGGTSYVAGDHIKISGNTISAYGFLTKESADTIYALSSDTRFHTHDNKSILDGIKQSDIDHWNSAYTWYNTSASTINSAVTDFRDYFYLSGDTVFTKYNLASEQEVSAYGKGEGGGGGSGYITIGGKQINSLSGKDGTNVYVEGTTGIISSHTHNNIDVLNSISSTTNWDNASTWVNSNSGLTDTVNTWVQTNSGKTESANTWVDSAKNKVLSAVTYTKLSAKTVEDSASTSGNTLLITGHSHTNYDALSCFTMDVSGNVHCSASFIGDQEVSAYGVGSGGGGGGGGYITVDGRNINKLSRKNHITFEGSGTELIIGDNVDLSEYLKTADADTKYIKTGDTKVTNWNNNYTWYSTAKDKVLSAVTYTENTGASVTDSASTQNNTLLITGHSHSNKAELDKIQTDDVAKWGSAYTWYNTSASTINSAVTDFRDYFYMSGGCLHTKYSFVGDKEVSAYGTGTSESGGSSIKISGKTINELASDGGTKITVSGTKATISSHTHSNIDVLSSITSTTKWDNASTWVNSNSGKTENVNTWVTSNSGITDTVNTWVQTNSGKTESANTWVDSAKNKVLSAVTYNENTGASVSDSAKTSNNSLLITGHSHTNKDAIDLFYVSDGVVHCSASFVGDKEVSAYGTGTSESGGSSIKVSGKTVNELASAGGTVINVSGTKATISSHTHNNMDVLTGITTAKTSNWDNAYTSAHTHSNKTVLDGITTAKTSNWDNAYTSAHTHSNKAVLDKLTQIVIDNSHTHSNKTELDKIQTDDVSKWNSAYTWYNTSASTINNGITDFRDWFYISDGMVHCKKSFVGDGEVSAYGSGTSESGSSGIKWGTKTITSVTAGTNITMSESNNKLTINATVPSDYVNSVTAVTSDATKFGGSISNKKLTLSGHTHTNKAVLDNLTQTVIDNSHTHTNKTVLDGITTAKTSSWDDVASYFAKTGTTIYTKNKEGLSATTLSVPSLKIYSVEDSETGEEKTILKQTTDGDFVVQVEDSGTIILSGDTSIRSGLTVYKNATVSGGTTLKSTLNVSGETKIINNFTVGKDTIPKVGEKDPTIKLIGDVTIGTSGGTITVGKPHNLTVNGNILATGECSCYSDIRLKSNIKQLEDRGTLHGYSYVKDGKPQLGVIAQQVQEAGYYEAVTENDNGYLSVNYNALVAVLIEKINNLEDEIENLKSKL